MDNTRQYVHRIVATAFLEIPDKYCEVDHINRVKEDNKASNLRWVTKSENAINRADRPTRSGYKNIELTAETTYRVRIRYEGRIIHKKTYKTLEEALEARNKYYPEV